MLSSNMACNLFSKQPFSVYGQDFNPNFVQSLDLSAFIHVAIMKLYILFVCITQFYPDQPNPFFLTLPTRIPPDTTLQESIMGMLWSYPNMIDNESVQIAEPGMVLCFALTRQDLTLYTLIIKEINSKGCKEAADFYHSQVCSQEKWVQPVYDCLFSLIYTALHDIFK
mgnify:CR=1 FL=1